MQEKECKKCNIILSLDNFNKQKNTKDGYKSWCRNCFKSYSKTYFNNNSLIIKEKQKNYRENNKEKLALYKHYYYLNNIENIKNYRLVNKDRINYIQKEYRLRNYDKISLYMKVYLKEYSIKYKDYISKQNKLYYKNNQINIRLSQKIYKQKNQWKFNAINAARRAVIGLRTPTWLTTAHKRQIELLYKKAKSLKLKTGINYHVDHIIPLMNKEVCGLHVPWNLQVITAKENLEKGNKF